MPKPQSKPLPPAKDDQLDHLVDGLSLNADTVLQDASHLAHQFLDAANYRVQKMRKEVEAEMALDVARAEAEIEIRNSATQTGEKVTENHIKAHLILNPEVAAATKLFNDRQAEHEYGKLLVEAYRIKRDCLKAVCDLTSAERAIERIVGMSTTSLQEVRNKAKSKYPGVA